MPSTGRFAVAFAVLLVSGRAPAATTIVAGPTVTVEGRQVTVTWETLASASSEIAWGPTAQANFGLFPNKQGSSTPTGWVHSRTLRRLPPGDWYIQVRSDDGTGPVDSTPMQVTVPPSQAFPAGDLSLNGPVLASSTRGGVRYLAGAFTQVGQTSGGGVVVGPPVGSVGQLLLPHFPEVAGRVYAVRPDGSGGYYIGGAFRSVGGLPRQNLAHLLPDYGVDPNWAPSVDGPVFSMEMSGDGQWVFVGGAFTRAGASACANLARFRRVAPNPGAHDPAFCPAPNGAVRALSGMAGLLLLGGEFTQVLGTPRGFAAALEVSNATATLHAWDPGFDGAVLAINAETTYAYVGGRFTTALSGSVPFPYVVGYSVVSNNLVLKTSWAPRPDGPVNTIIVDSLGQVFLGGEFQNVNVATLPVARPLLALVNSSDGAIVSSFNAQLVGTSVRALNPFSGPLLVGGSFRSARSVLRPNLVAVDPATGAVQAWAPDPEGPVHALASEPGNSVFVGGEFAFLDGTRRNGAAAIGPTGNLLPWDPGVEGDVRAMAVGSSAIFLGGNFTRVNGNLTLRRRAAAFDLSTGTALPFDPSLDGEVEAMDLFPNNTLLIGGRFTRANQSPLPDGGFTAGFDRRALVKVDQTTGGVAASFNPSPDLAVLAIKTTPWGALVGGEFTSIGGQARTYGALLDLDGGLDPWSPNLDDAVRAIEATNRRVYLGGRFRSSNGAPRAGVAAFDSVTGQLDPVFNAKLASSSLVVVDALALASSSLYVGGNFLTADGNPEQGLVQVETASGLARQLNKSFDRAVSSLSLDCAAGRLLVGGDFFAVGPAPRAGLAELDSAGAGCAPTLTVRPGGAVVVDGGITLVDGGVVLPDGGFPFALALALPETALLGLPVEGTLTVTGPVGAPTDRLSVALSGSLLAVEAREGQAALAGDPSGYRLSGTALASGSATLTVRVRGQSPGAQTLIATLRDAARGELASTEGRLEVLEPELSPGFCGCRTSGSGLTLALVALAAAARRAAKRPR